ncbi:MAG: hypothetical protein AMXMBFR13_12730 [Phycisphaerae bacterium]
MGCWLWVVKRQAELRAEARVLSRTECLMQRAAFERLDVYRLAEDLADQVWGLVLPWNTFARDTVGKQLVKSADSIGANIAEGYGRGSQKDNHRFVRISRGSLNETLHWLRRAYRRNLLNTSQISRLKALVSELGPRLNGYLDFIERTASRRLSRPTTRNQQPATRAKSRKSSR